MRSHSRHVDRSTARWPAVCGVLALLGAFLTGCSTPEPIKAALDQIAAAQNAIQRESSAWRNELPQLQSDLDALVVRQQGEAAAAVKQVLTDATNAVRSLAEDTIKVAALTVEQQTAKFGSEVRCSVDFARVLVSASLSTLAERLKFWKKNHTLPPPPPHSVCQVTPDNVELHSTGLDGGWSMTQPADKLVGVYGYDFRGDALPAVELQAKDGSVLATSKVVASYVTRYQLNLDFTDEDLRLITPGTRYVLKWPDQPEPNTISVTLVNPGRLKILGVDMKSAVRAKYEPVRPVVDIVNEGGSDSGSFMVTWTPGPGLEVKSFSVDNLAAGERQKFTFPQPVYYPAEGTFQTAITAGRSGSWDGWINVTPYAVVPHEQTIHIWGQWPKAGGNIGEQMPFTLETIRLGDDCELDTTRGGGSFPQINIDNDDYSYDVTWPKGYHFTFTSGKNHIWRSVSSLSAEYDQAPFRSITPTVTLRGIGHHWFPDNSRGPERFDGYFTVYSMCPK